MLDLCTCYDQNVISIEGKPQSISLTTEHALWMLQDVDCILPIRLQDTPDIRELTRLASYKVPLHVMIGDDVGYGYKVIELLRNIPHSIMITEITSDTNYSELREMLHLAKSHKIMITIVINYQPHITRKVDIFSMIEQVKNYVSHALIMVPTRISDEDIYSSKESYSASRLRKAYTADIPSRYWLLNKTALAPVVSDIEKYLKDRKISCDWLDLDAPHIKGKTRYESNTGKSLPLGIRTFTYVKDNSIGTFVETEVSEPSCCQKCNNPIF